MKFVWCLGWGEVVQPRAPWSWLQLFRDNRAQRRAERRQRAQRDADGVAYPTEWWK